MNVVKNGESSSPISELDKQPPSVFPPGNVSTGSGKTAAQDSSANPEEQPAISEDDIKHASNSDLGKDTERDDSKKNISGNEKTLHSDTEIKKKEREQKREKTRTEADSKNTETETDSKNTETEAKEISVSNRETVREGVSGQSDKEPSELIKRITQKLDALKGTHKGRLEPESSSVKSGPALLSVADKKEKVNVAPEPKKSLSVSGSLGESSSGASATMQLQLHGYRSFSELSDEELIKYAKENVWSSERSRKHSPPPTPPSHPKKKTKPVSSKAVSKKNDSKAGSKVESENGITGTAKKAKTGKAKKKTSDDD
ncbi:MAG: hypothetical protein HQM09_10505 [Candidatus Riflebacteria bacterium]|nr:hypothetical protein [Candidatus Riflebacteria bacterium]